MKSNDGDVTNIKEAIVGKQAGQSGTQFMDALRLAHMLQARAIMDVESKAAAMGASKESIDKLKDDILKLAAATPIDRFLVSTACMRVSNYLIEAMPAYFKNTRAGLGRKESVLKSLVAVGEKSGAARKIHLAQDFYVNSSLPVIIFGKRSDLEAVTEFILDKAAVETVSCLHFSLRSFNKRLNKFYKRIRPEDWADKLRVKEDFYKFLINAGKFRPVELVLVDELSNGFNPDKSKRIERKGSLQEAFVCFKKLKLHSCNKGICSVSMYATDGMDSDIAGKSLQGFYDIGAPLDCSSEGKKTLLTDSTGKVVLTISR